MLFFHAIYKGKKTWGRRLFFQLALCTFNSLKITTKFSYSSCNDIILIPVQHACKRTLFCIFRIIFGNNIESIQEGILKSQKLQGLGLAQNGIKTLAPNSFKEIPNLSALMLTNNSLKSLPDELFLHNIGLRYFNASYNKLESIPDQLFKPTRQLSVL